MIEKFSFLYNNSLTFSIRDMMQWEWMVKRKNKPSKDYSVMYTIAFTAKVWGIYVTVNI